METFVYPQIEWLEAAAKLYDAGFEQKLAKLSGTFAFRIGAEPAWGINEDIYFGLNLDAGKLKELKNCTKENAFKRFDFIFGATPQAWKRVLTKKDKFVGAFMGGRVKLEKGDTVGALAVGPHATTLVEVLTQPVKLVFPDDLSPEELEKFKKAFAEKRKQVGV
jgi:putative sterol carrier protein